MGSSSAGFDLALAFDKNLYLKGSTMDQHKKPILLKTKKVRNVVRLRALNAKVVGVRQCPWCMETKDIKEFPRCGNSKEGRRRQCNICHKTRQANDATLKRAKENPQDHLQCNDCERIYSVKKFKTKELLEKYLNECRYCGSNDVEDYLPETSEV